MNAPAVISNALRLAQLYAMVGRADQDGGASYSRIELYDTARPEGGQPPLGAAQVVLTLARPCGQIVDGALQLRLLDTQGGMALRDGQPLWGRWIAADGQWLLDADVTAEAVEGEFTFVILGTTPPAGEDAPWLYAGGVVPLDEVALT